VYIKAQGSKVSTLLFSPSSSLNPPRCYSNSPPASPSSVSWPRPLLQAPLPMADATVVVMLLPSSRRRRPLRRPRRASPRPPDRPLTTFSTRFLRCSRLSRLDPPMKVPGPLLWFPLSVSALYLWLDPPLSVSIAKTRSSASTLQGLGSVIPLSKTAELCLG
jgi:hypothetical protein